MNNREKAQLDEAAFFRTLKDLLDRDPSDFPHIHNHFFEDSDRFLQYFNSKCAQIGQLYAKQYMNEHHTCQGGKYILTFHKKNGGEQ